MTTRRQERIAELLHEDLSLLIGAELDDPRLADAMLNVTHVTVSPDLRNASVYVEHSLPAESGRQILAALHHAQSFLRRALIEHLNLRVTPELTFHIDDTAVRSQRIDVLLETITERPRLAESSTDEHIG